MFIFSVFLFLLLVLSVQTLSQITWLLSFNFTNRIVIGLIYSVTFVTGVLRTCHRFFHSYYRSFSVRHSYSLLFLIWIFCFFLRFSFSCLPACKKNRFCCSSFSSIISYVSHSVIRPLFYFPFLLLFFPLHLFFQHCEESFHQGYFTFIHFYKFVLTKHKSLLQYVSSVVSTVKDSTFNFNH